MQTQTSPSRTPREHPRVAATVPVEVRLPGRTVVTKARNLSMTGLFIDRGDVPNEVALRIALPGVARLVETRGKVQRREAKGVALSFADIAWDDLLLMARYLAPRL